MNADTAEQLAMQVAALRRHVVRVTEELRTEVQQLAEGVEGVDARLELLEARIEKGLSLTRYAVLAPLLQGSATT